MEGVSAKYLLSFDKMGNVNDKLLNVLIDIAYSKRQKKLGEVGYFDDYCVNARKPAEMALTTLFHACETGVEFQNNESIISARMGKHGYNSWTGEALRQDMQACWVKNQMTPKGPCSRQAE